jgi:putative Holliday junction resolvase
VEKTWLFLQGMVVFFSISLVITAPRVSMPRERGVDYGEVRIGLALSDETGTLASPLATLRRRRGKRPPLKEIEGTARTHEVQALIVGLPLELSGEESEWTREVRDVALKLGVRLGIPVHLVDERMTSVRAERAIRSIGLRRSEREEKARIDSAAAAIILQSWLDTREKGK